MDRFRVGDTVKTIADDGRTDWADNDAARKRPWNVVGTIQEVYDGHGLCYRVAVNLPGSSRLSSVLYSQEYYYNHSELKLV